MKIIAEILSIVILLAGMASCTKTDRLYDDDMTEIAMRPVMSVMPKAPVTGTEYPAGASFGVNAYYSSDYSHGQEWTSVSSVQPYFENRKFVKEGETFSGDPDCYWPHAGSLVFVGYSPYDADSDFSFDLSTKTLKIDNFTSNGQTDLMYFLPELSDGSLKGLNTSTTPVPASFNHALSLISFNVSAMSGDEDDVRLKEINILSAKCTGDFSVNASAPNDGEWTGQTGPSDIEAFKSESGHLLTVAATSDVLVIPGDAAVIEIVYETKFHDMASREDVFKELRPMISPTDITKWETGKKYIYNVAIGANKIEVSPSTGYIGVIERETESE